MENASKALLISAGVLLTMMMVSLIIFARGRIGEFYDNEHKLEEIDNLAEFNAQFTSFDRKNVYGYEIISLTNKVADYNKRYSNHTDAKNNIGYNPVTITISFQNNKNLVKDKIWYDNKGRIFEVDTEPVLTQNDTKNDLVNKILKATKIEDFYGSSEIAVNLGKSIKSILAASNNSEVDYYKTTKKIADRQEAIKQLKLIGLNTYNKITKGNETNYERMKDTLTKEDVLAYYEYNQFKKAKFDCTGIKYDEGQTGRVIEIDFEFNGHVE